MITSADLAELRRLYKKFGPASIATISTRIPDLFDAAEALLAIVAINKDEDCYGDFSKRVVAVLAGLERAT